MDDLCTCTTGSIQETTGSIQETRHPLYPLPRQSYVQYVRHAARHHHITTSPQRKQRRDGPPVDRLLPVLPCQTPYPYPPFVVRANERELANEKGTRLKSADLCEHRPTARIRPGPKVDSSRGNAAPGVERRKEQFA